MTLSPLHEYLARKEARRAARDRLNGADARFGYARLATFASAALLAFLAWRAALSAWWLLVPAAIFVWLARRHDRVLRARDAAIRGIAFYERGLARLEDRWIGTGDPGDRFRDDRHVYANDLDLFGRGSLFELLSLARTRSGEETLASWLTSAADVSEIQARQEAVEELSSRLDLREQLALAGGAIRAGVQTDRLLRWAESPAPHLQGLQAFTWLFTAAILLAIAFTALTSTWWPLSALMAWQFVCFRLFREQMNATLSTREPGAVPDVIADPLTHRALDLDVIGDLLKRLEPESFGSSRLALLRSRLAAHGRRASRIIR